MIKITGCASHRCRHNRVSNAVTCVTFSISNYGHFLLPVSCISNKTKGPRARPYMKRRNVRLSYSDFQRDLAAFLAMALRLAGLRDLALAAPPFLPPIFPRATAWGLRASMGISRGLPSICSPIARSTTSRATCIKSRFSPERFGMALSCHEFEKGCESIKFQTDPLPHPDIPIPVIRRAAIVLGSSFAGHGVSFP